MILILSEENELSTNYVIDWLNYYQSSYIRVNQEDEIILSEFNLENSEIDLNLSSNDYSFNLSDISCVWYRRGFINLKFFLFGKNLKDNIKDRVRNEYSQFSSFLYELLFNKPSLNSFQHAVVDKLLVLNKAKQLDLKIPQTYLVRSKRKLQSILNSHDIISKGIFETIDCKFNGYQIRGLTQEISKDDLKRIPDNFELSMVQQKLSKKYEIRSFILDNNVYSMAIFSQTNSKTELDFRNYDDIKPNRTVPYNLPTEIEKKLVALEGLPI